MTILKALLNKLSKIKVFEDNFGEVKELLKYSVEEKRITLFWLENLGLAKQP